MIAALAPQGTGPMCATCLFWCAVDGGGPTGEPPAGLCRRHAPQARPRMFLRANTPRGFRHPASPDYVECDLYANASLWPLTHADEWCGEYRPREEAP